MQIPTADPRAAHDQVNRGSLRPQVTARILAAVFERRFRPGQRLVVQRLAELYGVSPTPVREALVELAGIGIVELLPNRGAIVRPFGPQEVRDISQVRRVLEAEAARSACGRADSAELAGLDRELARLADLPRDESWDQGARAADTWLHSLIAESCGNARLTAEINRYLTLVRTLRDVSHLRDAWTNYRRSDDVAQHRAIVGALLAHDAAEAAAAMDRHIQSAGQALEEIVFGGPADPAGPPATKSGAVPADPFSCP
jgi:DNA-binding GntR family transcriptional regulator